MDKIGLVGVPSLWMNYDELLKEKHITKSLIEEEERIGKIQHVLRIHKKWETEKYFT